MIIDAEKFYTKYSDRDTMLAIAAVMIVISAFFLFLIVRVIIPADIVTTALGLSKLVRPVIVTAPQDMLWLTSWFGATNGGVTFEGLTFGSALFLSAVLFAFTSDRMGDWVNNKPMSFISFAISSLRGEIPPEQINRAKVGVFSLFILVETIDIATDLAWRWLRAPNTEDDVINIIFAIAVVIVFNFILSELATIVSIQTIFASIMFIWRGYIANIFSLPGKKNRVNTHQKRPGYNQPPPNQAPPRTVPPAPPPKNHANNGQDGGNFHRGQAQPHRQPPPVPQGRPNRGVGQPTVNMGGLRIPTPATVGYDDLDELIDEFEN